MENVMLTTIDNPFDPFTQFKEWHQFDEGHGYYTCGYIARIAMTSVELSDEHQAELISDAIDEIVGFNLSGKYKKVYKN